MFFVDKAYQDRIRSSRAQNTLISPIYIFESAHQSGINAINVYPKVIRFTPKKETSTFQTQPIILSSGGDDESIFTAFVSFIWKDKGPVALENVRKASTKSIHCSSLRAVEIMERGDDRFILTTGLDQILAIWRVEEAAGQISLNLVKDTPICASHTTGLALLPSPGYVIEFTGSEKSRDRLVRVAVAGQGLQVLELTL